MHLKTSGNESKEVTDILFGGGEQTVVPTPRSNCSKVNLGCCSDKHFLAAITSSDVLVKAINVIHFHICTKASNLAQMMLIPYYFRVLESSANEHCLDLNVSLFT